MQSSRTLYFLKKIAIASQIPLGVTLVKNMYSPTIGIAEEILLAGCLRRARCKARRFRTFVLVALFCWCLNSVKADAFTLLSSNQFAFVNVDHAPVGACSTFFYGDKGDRCGLGMSSDSVPYEHGGGGVVIALSGKIGLRAFPFVGSTSDISSDAIYFTDANIRRHLTPCADRWTVRHEGLSFTQYSPVWQMVSLRGATLAQKKRFFLPATWIEFTVTNATSRSEKFYFGLPVAAERKSFCHDAYQGFTYREAALAVKSGACELLDGPRLKAALNGMSKGFAFCMKVEPGKTKSLMVVIAYYRKSVVDTRIPAWDYYTSFFHSMGDVIRTAFAEYAEAKARCQQMAVVMRNSDLNFYRQFLASYALHSFQACTFCLRGEDHRVYWREMEGAYNNINTLDLTVDVAFYDAIMEPWALRNVLDVYSGMANGGRSYTFTHPLYDAVTGAKVSPNGFSFHHDMGNGLTSDPPDRDPTGYERDRTYMGQEELQNWILSAGIYWNRTHNNAWLKRNSSLLQKCLTSELLRDNPDPALRNGTTDYVNKRGPVEEITTFDCGALGSDLKQARLNGRMTVRSWACYVALQAMFNELGDSPHANVCREQAAVCARSIVKAWDPKLGYIPALLDGSNTNAITSKQKADIPWWHDYGMQGSNTNAITAMVEGLVYPQFMGLTNAVDRFNGPYAAMLQTLRKHLVDILVPGKCLNARTGAWKLASDSDDTVPSKIYLYQYIAGQILGLTGNVIDGKVDQIAASLQLEEAPYQGFSDQISTAGPGDPTYPRGLHYPRAVTTALWWLNTKNAKNDPAF